MILEAASIDRGQVNRFLRRKGLTAVADKSKADHLQVFGLKPDVVLDIGVDTGTPSLYAAFPNAHFVLVDPRAECRAVLGDAGTPPNTVFFETALGSKTGTLTLNIPTSEWPWVSELGD